jgi:hypothetical protein
MINGEQERDVDPCHVPVGARQAIELHLLAIPKNTERQKAHEISDQLRRHGGQRMPEVLLGADRLFDGSVEIQHK